MFKRVSALISKVKGQLAAGRLHRCLMVTFDVLGTRKGFILIMLWWSGARAMYGLAMSFGIWLIARRFLMMGAGGTSPAATRVVAGCISAEQRVALVTGTNPFSADPQSVPESTPLRRAVATASVRSVTCNFSIMLFTWWRTVLSLILRASAICLFVEP